MRLVPIVLVLCASSILAGRAIAADPPPKIYECKDAKGETVYQDDPCLDTPLPAPTAKTQVAGKPKATAKPAAGAKPKAAAKTAAAQKPQAGAKQEITAATGPKPWAAVLPSAPPLPAGSLSIASPDARWSSPQRALQTFVGAVNAGDRTLVVACLTASALADLGPDAEEVPLEDLRATVGSFTGYVVEGDLGPYWSIRALRTGTRPKWIFFERTGNGEWKIGAI